MLKYILLDCFIRPFRRVKAKHAKKKIVARTTFFTLQSAMLMPAFCYVYVYQLHHYSAVDSWQDRWCLDISAASRPPSWCVCTRNMVAKWSISVRTVMLGHMLCFRQRPFLFSFFLPFSSIITSIFSEAFLAHRCRYIHRYIKLNQIAFILWSNQG